MSAKNTSARLLGWIRARPGLLGAALLACVGVMALGAGLALGSWQAVCRDCPSIALISTWEPQQSTKLFARDGQLIHEFFNEWRTPVSISDLPLHVPAAFVAVEDKRFYHHSGLDYVRILGAAARNVLSGRVTGGASTITQQLARNIFASHVGWDSEIDGRATFWDRVKRKLKEAHVALQLEQVYTKDQILEAYINQIHYGQGWHGIETAATRYFGKTSAQLNPAEAAMLASVIKLTSAYSPFRNPEAARARRNMVLRLMAEQGVLTQQEAVRWQQEPLPEAPFVATQRELAPYYVEWVRQMLEARYGNDLYSKGLRIHTSLDVEMQRRANAAMEEGWSRIEGTPGYRHVKYADVVAESAAAGREGESKYVQGMFIALDPHTGEVLALVGGRDFSHSKFNRAIQARRQAGSSFKLFVYTAAIASGFPPSHVIFDTPVDYLQPDSTIWSPKNFTDDFRGPMTLRTALQSSTNVVAVKLAEEVGLETVAQYARRMGIQTDIPRVPSMAIGSPDVIPIEIASAYGTIATGGIRVEPRPILRVEDASGRVLWESRADSTRVLDPVAAALVRDMLQSVTDIGGTAFGIRNYLPPEIPAAGKTGTTNESTNVWFIGFTPDVLAAVWFGFDMPTQITSNATGGGFAAPVWARFMSDVYLGESPLLPTPEPWVLPDVITSYRIDKETGKLATEWCPLSNVYVEKFVPGTAPTEACDLHGPGLFPGTLWRGIDLDLPPIPTTYPEAPVDSTAPDTDETQPDIPDVRPEVPNDF